MKTHLAIAGILSVALLASASDSQNVVKVKTQKMRMITRALLQDKIKGGWAGKMAGVTYGAPTEFKACGKIVDVIPVWQPDQIAGAISQDDLYVQMTFAAVLDKIGLNATCEQFGDAFKDSKYGVWHANAAARRNLNRGIKAPWSGRPEYNPHADDIDFQIEADFIGMMCPGLPIVANDYCDRVGHVMNYGDGVYGGMWLSGMYAAAFFESDPRKVVEAGLASIPSRSKYAELIRDVLNWEKQFPDNWTNCWQKLEEKWDKDDICPDGALQPFNIDAKLNGGYIAIGLLYGGGDFSRTLEIATRAGQDSDCNPSTAGGILGVMCGYKKIPAGWTSGLDKVADTKFEFTDYTFKEIVQATEKHALEVIARAGGKVSDIDAAIPLQAIPHLKRDRVKLEQWRPGVPDKRIACNDSAWAWSGEWKGDHRGKTAAGADSEVTLNFNGVAAVLVGVVDENSGRADVYVDGEKSSRVLDAYAAGNTHDTALWHVFGLQPGDHTLRIVPSGSADSRSKGKAVTISEAVVYRAK